MSSKVSGNSINRLLGYSCLSLFVVGGISTTFWLWKKWDAKFVESRTVSATTALDNSKFDEALRLARSVLDRRPLDSRVMRVAARAAAATSRWDEAFEICDRMSGSDRKDAASKFHQLGESFTRSGHARRAEESLRLALRLDPLNLNSRFFLSYIYAAEGRTWEASPLIRTLIEAGRLDIIQIQYVGASDEFFINIPQFAQQCLAAVPDDPLPLLGSARNFLKDGNESSAEPLLRRIVKRDPNLIEAQARLGLLLVDSQRDDEAARWNNSLPSTADSFPDIWIARGLYAMQHDQRSAAIRCFGQAARLDPNCRVAHFHLGHLLFEVGQKEQAVEFKTRAEKLSELLVPLNTITENVDEQIVRHAAELCEVLGRPLEAIVWSEVALRSHPESTWAPELIERVLRKHSGQPPWIVDEARLADRLELQRYPLLDWQAPSKPAQSSQPVPAKIADSKIRFSEDAAMLGINFRFYNDSASPENTLKIYEFSGGGLGVIDFDADGWPDLYAAQGSRFPLDPDPPSHWDRLYRSRGDDHFDDVTEFSRIRDSRFSQGVTAGDFDQDGFPDLYLANIGLNRLFKNNGDGTFTDVTDLAGLHDDDWTTSCVLADINGDTWPDIVAVNYLKGSDVYDRVCGTPDHPRSCMPANFEPQQDRLWINRGDGRFEEQTQSALISEQSVGRGLGIVVAAIDRPSRPNIFIANDTDPNFLYVNRTVESGGRPQFEERGIVDGFAFDAEGRPQASMGIATGDVNRDGRLDFFVTNFYRESNTLYIQQSDMSFLDMTSKAGLRDPSFLMLGFGTQFLDADADGWLDLILTNGHVFNNNHIGEPYRMPPQLFQNKNGQFTERPAAEIGQYFQGNYLGRALVSWDWNRDGWPDLAVSHLDAPLAVLTNRSESRFHTIVLSLRGIESNREAIGAIVHVTAGSERWMTTLTAGDGYMASNDRRLIVGLGSQTKIDEISIDWPSGRSQTYHEILVDREFLFVEGRSPIEMRRFPEPGEKQTATR